MAAVAAGVAPIVNWLDAGGDVVVAFNVMDSARAVGSVNSSPWNCRHWDWTQDRPKSPPASRSDRRPSRRSGYDAASSQPWWPAQRVDAGRVGDSDVLEQTPPIHLFGFKLASVNSSLTGATVAGPTGSPAAISVDLASNPNAGDSIEFGLTLPDGSSQSITLKATTTSPPGTNQFTIGATPAATAANLQAALTTAVGNLDQTVLPAASAVAAANDFFSSDPPQRVSGPPYDTATSLVNGTAADTVFWYTGENGSTPARQSATAEVGPSMTINYGVRANEQAISTLVANVAVLAATTYSASDPNAETSYQALSQKVTANLDGQSGTQSISDIEADLASAQTTVSNASSLNSQTQTTLQNLLQNIEGVNQNQIGEQVLTLQNSLSASMAVTARLAQLSLVNFLAPSAG